MLIVNVFCFLLLVFSALFILNFKPENKPSFKIFPTFPKTQIYKMLTNVALTCGTPEREARPEIKISKPDLTKKLFKIFEGCKYTIDFNKLLIHYSETLNALYSLPRLPEIKNYCRIYLIVKNILEFNKLEFKNEFIYYTNIFLLLTKEEIQSINLFVKICSFEALNIFEKKAEYRKETKGRIFDLAQKAIENIFGIKTYKTSDIILQKAEKEKVTVFDIKDCLLINDNLLLPLKSITIEKRITFTAELAEWSKKHSELENYLYEKLPRKLIEALNKPNDFIEIDAADFLGMFLLNSGFTTSAVNSEKLKLYCLNKHFEFLNAFSLAFIALYTDTTKLWRDNAFKYKKPLTDFYTLIINKSILNSSVDNNEIKLCLWFLWTLQLVLDCEENESNRLEFKQIITEMKSKLSVLIFERWDSVVSNCELYLLASITRVLPDYFLTNLLRCPFNNALAFFVFFEQMFGLKLSGKKIINISRKYNYNHKEIIEFEYPDEKFKIICTPKGGDISKLIVNGREYGNVNSLDLDGLNGNEVVWEI